MFIFALAKKKLGLAEELILIADGYRESPFSSDIEASGGCPFSSEWPHTQSYTGRGNWTQ